MSIISVNKTFTLLFCLSTVLFQPAILCDWIDILSEQISAKNKWDGTYAEQIIKDQIAADEESIKLFEDTLRTNKDVMGPIGVAELNAKIKKCTLQKSVHEKVLNKLKDIENNHALQHTLVSRLINVYQANLKLKVLAGQDKSSLSYGKKAVLNAKIYACSLKVAMYKMSVRAVLEI
jgi:hypothetical protein